MSVKNVCEASTKTAVIEAVAENNGSTDVTVDGSWQKRGIPPFMEFCRQHSLTLLRLLMFMCYMDLEAHDCVMNNNGASDDIEAMGAVTMFNKSVNECGLLYLKYLGMEILQMLQQTSYSSTMDWLSGGMWIM